MPKPTKAEKKVEEIEEVEQHDVEAENDTEEPSTIPCSEFDVSRLYFRAQIPDPNASQLMCFPKYLFGGTEMTEKNCEEKGQNAIIVTGPIKMVKGGIPKHDKKYHGTNENSMKRAYFYIPKNENDPNSMELFDCIQRFDDFMNEEINEKGNASKLLCVLSKKTKKRVPLKDLSYTRMISTAKPPKKKPGEEDEEEEESPKKGKKGGKDDKNQKKEFVPWERIKVKFSTQYDENLGPDDIKDITTQLYVGNNKDAEQCVRVTDFEKVFRWNCTAQFALMFNKVWIKQQDEQECSVGIRCLQIGITELSDFKKGSSISKNLNKRLFPMGKAISQPKDDEDGEEEPKKEVAKKSPASKSPAKTAAKPAAKPTAPVKGAKKGKADEDEEENAEGDEDNEENADENNEDNEDNDENEENEDASEPEDEPPKKKGGKAAPAKVDVKVKGKTPPAKTTAAKGKVPAKKGK